MNTPIHRYRQLISLLACLSLVGQPLVAAAQEFKYQVPLTDNNFEQATPGALQFTPATYDFGTLVLGSTASTTSVLKNTGQDSVQVTGIGIAAPYSQTNNCPATLIGGASCTVIVTYNPQEAGSHAGTLAVATSDVAAATGFNVTGSAVVPTTTLSLAPNSLTFSDTDVGTSAATQSVTVTNTGNSKALINGIGLSSGNADFNQSNNCDGMLMPGAKCTIVASFVPTVYGPLSGNINLYEFKSGAMYSIALSGFGNTAVLGTSGNSLDAHSAIVNYSTSTAQATIYNLGNRPMTGLSFDMGTSTEFSVSSKTCGTTLAAGENCTVTVTFAPKAAGARTGDLQVLSTNGGSGHFALTGTGIAQAPASTSTPASLAFGDIPVDGTSVAQTVTYKNTGNITLNMGGVSATTGGANYVATSDCAATLAVGATCTATIQFTPKAAGDQPGNLRALLSSGNIDTPLTGKGTLGLATLSAASLSFADQQVATASPAKTITVTNAGNRKLTFTHVGILTGAADFAQSNNCAVVEANSTCVVNVVFQPSKSGPLTGQLVLEHDGVGGVSTVDLFGAGRDQNAYLAAPTFTATAVNSSSNATATLTNTGIGPLAVTVPTAASVTGTGFSFVSTTCGTSVAVGQSCGVVVKFSPSSTNAASGELSVLTGAGVQKVTLGSTGIQGYATVNPGSLTFAAQQVASTSGSQKVTVTNTGTDTLTFTGVGISAGNTDFAQTNDCAAVPVNGTCSVNVNFSPSTTGTRTGTLSFVHNGGGIANVSLTGTGQAQSATLSNISFGAVNAGSSANGVATLSNTGIGTLAVTVPAAGSVTGTDFSFVSTTCGTSLAVGASCTVTVKLAPASGGARNGTLTVATGAGSKTASLTGSGNQPVLAFSSAAGTTLTWGNQQVGGTYNSISVTLTNSGNMAANSLVLTPSPAVFGLTSNTCGTSLAAGSTCTFTLTFSPAAAQAYNGTLTVAAAQAVVNNSMAMTGTGQVQSGTLSTPSFPATSVGSSSTGTATLTNTGVGPLSVTVPSAASVTGTDFAFSATTCGTSIAVGSSCTVTVRFAPTSTAARSGTLSVATGGGTYTASLGSTGIQGYASISPSSLTFGTTTVGSTAAAQTITVTNTGTDVLTFSGVGIAAGAPEYQQSNNCGAVPVNGTCSVSVNFTPSATGTRSGTVGFTHNGGGMAAVSLSGTGATYSWQNNAWTTPSACGTTTSTRSVWCQRNDGTTVADSFCSGTKPTATQAATDYNSCTYSFSYGNWSTPSACGTTTQTRTASCIRSDGTTVANSYCGTPVTSQSSTDYSACTYGFSYGAWDSPSGCGTVTQSRSASCIRSDGTSVANSYCGTPTTTQSATNYNSCSYSWSSGGWSTPSACGSTTATRSVWCTRSDGTTVADSSCNVGTKPATSTGTTDYSSCTYAWATSGWSTPSGCGAVTATRSVWCQRSDGTSVADGYCGGAKPASSTASSSTSSCTYSFSYGSWSTPNGCGTVTQTRSATCYRSDGTAVANSYCGTPTTSQSTTNYNSCTYSFSYGAWTQPSGCGTVTQSRGAACIRSDGTTVSNSYCGSPVTSQQATDYRSCTYSASYGSWGACSGSCGTTGTQTRSVSCTRSDGASVSTSYCGSPATSQSCSMPACAPVCPAQQTYCEWVPNPYWQGDPYDREAGDNQWVTYSYSGPNCTESVYYGAHCP